MVKNRLLCYYFHLLASIMHCNLSGGIATCFLDAGVQHDFLCK